MLSHPPDADHVGAVAHPEDLAAGPPAVDRLAHAQPEDDLGSIGDPVDPLDQAPLRLAVVAERIGPPEDLREQGQVERGLVVGRRMQHRRHLDPADPDHDRVIQVGVEHRYVGAAVGQRVGQTGADRPAELDPAKGVGARHMARRQPELLVERVERGATAPRPSRTGGR